MAGDEALKEELLSQNLPEVFDLVVVNMDELLFEGKVKLIIAPGPFGNFAILPGHTPLFIKLEPGKLVIHTESSNKEIEIGEGIAKITQSKAVILVGFEAKNLQKNKKG